MKTIATFWSFLACVFFAKAQQEDNYFPPPENPVEINATRAQGIIQIDGKLDEPDWANAPEVNEFYRVEPLQGGSYNYKTRVKILYDDKNIYFGVFCEDSLATSGYRMQGLSRDFSSNENEVFGIQIDAQNTKQYAVSFQTTPFSNQLDLQNFNDSNTDVDWNALWTVRTQRVENGWFAEFAIPFKTIRYDKPDAGQPVSWGITFYRLARRDFEKTVFPPIPQSLSQYRMTYAAKLTGLEVPPPAANIRIEPYSLYQYDENKTGNSLTNKNNNVKIGGDAKWVISPNAVLDLTINTDFAQADVDRAVVNLERFNIFFPERRQFFLENSGIWSGGSNTQVRPFFSRTIGLEGTFNATPAPIDVGTRFTNKNENQTIAGMYVRQRETVNSPTANFGVARYIKNYGKENNVGIMLTHRLDERSNDLSLSQKQNSTLTLDGLIRPNSELTITYMGSFSNDDELNTKGLAGRMFAGRRTKDFYLGYVNTFVSQDYKADMGFVFQNNVMHHSPGGYYRWRPKKESSIIRFWDVGSFIDYYHDLSDFSNFQQASIYVFPVYIIFKDNGLLRYAITPTWQNINFDFAPLGIQLEQKNYFYTTQVVQYNSDQSKKLSFVINYVWGSFYNGKRQNIFSSIRYSPIPNISVGGNYEHNSLKNLGVDNENKKTDLYSANLRLALNPRVQLSTFYQFNSFVEQGRWNVRFSWEYMPLSFIYLVFNDTQTDLIDPVQSSRQFISKITFLKQF